MKITFTNYFKIKLILLLIGIATLTLPANAQVDSLFNKFTITLNHTPLDIFTNLTSTYQNDNEVTIEASTTNACYTFEKWTRPDGTTVSTNASYTFTLSQDTTLTANFDTVQYYLTLSVLGGGTILPYIGTHAYYCGSVQTIFAIPPATDACYEFKYWADKSGDTISTVNPWPIQMNSDTAITAVFESQQYTLTVSATLGGSVSPSGTSVRDCNDSVAIEATPFDACYKFAAWVDGEGFFVSADNPLRVAMARDTVLRATFELLEYSLTLQVDPAESGNVFGNGRYDCGTEIEIRAEAEKCYEFTSWADGSPENPRPVRLLGDSIITANFTLKQFELTLNAVPVGGGTVAGAGVYDCNDEVTITAAPADGYTFLYWKDVATGETIYTPVAQVKMDKSKHWTAYFEVLPPDMFIVRLLAEPDGAGILSGGGTYSEGTDIWIVVEPERCFEFAGWTTTDGEFVTSELNFAHTVTQDTTFVAHFAPIYYNIELAVLPADAGNVSGTGEYACGARATAGAVSGACYEFVNWTNNEGKVLSENPNYTFTVASDTNLTANFRTRIYTITTSVSPVGSGSVAGGGKYNCGTEAMLEATPNAGFEFLNWTSGNRVLSSANPLTLAVTGDSAIVANFIAREEDKIFIRLQAEPAAGAAELRGGGLYNAGEMVSLRATPNTNYTFSKWTDINGTELSTANPYHIQVLQDSVIVAHFESILPNYTVFASTEPAEGGTVTGQGRHPENTVVTLEATASACYKFKHWTTETGEFVSSENPLTFTIKHDTAFIAQFDLLRYEVEAQVNPQNSGSVSGAGTYNCGQTAELIAKPNPGFKFINWATIDSKILQNANDTLHITVASDTTVIANFAREGVEVFTLTLLAEPDGAGVLTGAGNYEINEIAKIEATENANYRFINWTDTAGNVVSNAMQFDWTVKSDTTFVAHFEQVDLPVPTVHFTIKMSEHKLLDPRWQNYEIPIYITADADISDIVVDELVVTLRKDIFYPRAVSSGKFSNVVTETERVITITDIKIPRLARGTEQILTKIIGDVMLGSSDSSALVLSDNLLLPVANYLPTYALINGYITLDVCDFGEQRLVGTGTGSPTLTLKNNPVGELLELECSNLSAGNYTIEIMDLAGGTAKVAEFSVAEDASKYSVEVSVKDYVNGTYFVILGTQTGRHAAKMAVER